MAGFEGVKWATKQMKYTLNDKDFELCDADARVFAVSKSIHYGLFLAFEGIRFYCRRKDNQKLELVFLNWKQNLKRFQRGIAYNLGRNQQHLVPAIEEMESIFIRFFRSPAMLTFFGEMADLDAQGYLRPFTVDEQQSIGVTFPMEPSIRAAVCRYDRYLGEPFSGVVVPNIVRAVSVNGTGELKLGSNYLISVKAVDMAKMLDPSASTALLLDDRTHLPIEERQITEWDTSCCLFALRDGSVIKIPENPLILPSVTIQGIVVILRHKGVPVVERHLSYGELIEYMQEDQLVAICSIGTAGILNRCQKLGLTDADSKLIATHSADETHPLYAKLSEARSIYWDIYKGKAEVPDGLDLNRYPLNE
ncbi:hypothetical protein JXJ21_14975 [candidate division KSB1 bacterium]|nr:hypothetical protein [candidate division KSB1 bacterium]